MGKFAPFLMLFFLSCSDTPVQLAVTLNTAAVSGTITEFFFLAKMGTDQRIYPESCVSISSVDQKQCIKTTSCGVFNNLVPNFKLELPSSFSEKNVILDACAFDGSHALIGSGQTTPPGFLNTLGTSVHVDLADSPVPDSNCSFDLPEACP